MIINDYVTRLVTVRRVYKIMRETDNGDETDNKSITYDRKY